MRQREYKEVHPSELVKLQTQPSDAAPEGVTVVEPKQAGLSAGYDVLARTYHDNAAAGKPPNAGVINGELRVAGGQKVSMASGQGALVGFLATLTEKQRERWLKRHASKAEPEAAVRQKANRKAKNRKVNKARSESRRRNRAR